MHTSRDNLAIIEKKLFAQPNSRLRCVKSLLPPAAAEYYFERHIIFEISLREISKMMCLSKDNLARSAVKTFLHNLKKSLLPPAAAKDFWYKPKNHFLWQ